MAVHGRTAIDGLKAIAASASIPVWAARATGFLLPQGLIALLLHALSGFTLDHNTMPIGVRLDPLHALMHVVWGAAGAYAGFVRPRLAVPYLIVFGVYYIVVSMFGTFTSFHFGLQLGPRENLAHWTLGPLGLLIGLYGLLREERSK